MRSACDDQGIIEFYPYNVRTGSFSDSGDQLCIKKTTTTKKSEFYATYEY